MKWIDRAVDYVANRVLDRMEERRPAPVNNITVNNSRDKPAPGAGEAARMGIELLNRSIRHAAGRF